MILDTNAVSALAGRDPDILRLLGKSEPPVLCFVSVAEFHFGLLGSSQSEAGIAFLDRLIADLPVLFPNPETLAHYAWIADYLKRRGRPIPQNDLWIAALARQHGMPILSRDRHFDVIDGNQRLEW